MCSPEERDAAAALASAADGAPDDDAATAVAAPVITIGIAGGTGAGKSTLAQILRERLGGDDHVAYLVHDYYYKGDATKSLEERAKVNYDHPESLETALLVEHVRALKRGRAVDVPNYCFNTHLRKDETVRMEPKRILLVEGILIFCHPELVDELDIKVFVDADADVRLMRRISRDVQERGRTVDCVLRQYNETVRPMHQAWVEPSKTKADLIVHSAAHSMEVAIEMLSNHLHVKANIPIPESTTTTTTTKHETQHKKVE